MEDGRKESMNVNYAQKIMKLLKGRDRNFVLMLVGRLIEEERELIKFIENAKNATKNSE